jgi:N-acetylglutamate synthase-like GNAT family acetyltransferase
MKDFNIKQGQIEDLDLVKSLWEKLNDLHESLSPHFKDRFQKMNWEKRKRNLVNKSSKLRLDYVIDNKTGNIVGYCISTIEKENEKIGEIDSIFIEKELRKSGIGKQLMENAINWLVSQKTETQKLFVCVGNECVIDYYKQFDFLPLYIVLQRKD